MTPNVEMIEHVQSINALIPVTYLSLVAKMRYVKRYRIDQFASAQMDGQAILTRNAFNVG